jgi:alpha-tubulin suppressor-like RCC1 family protein
MLARQTFTANGNFTAPAGVATVKVIGTQNQQSASFANVSMILASDGLVYSWGNNGQGEAGNGASLGAVTAPAVLLENNPFIYISLTQFTNCSAYGISKSGDMYAWGSNGNGNLGVGDVTSRSSPVIVLGGLKWKFIAGATGVATGVRTVHALTLAGVPYAWGSNTQGELGVGDVTPRSSPVAVLGGLSFTTLVKGLGNTNGSSVFGLTAAGAAYGWGYNVNGGLGVGDVNARSSPVAVLGGLTFKQVFVDIQSGATTYGLTAAGALYAWGLNANGQLGVGDVTPRSSPVAVLGGLSFAQLSAAAGSVIAITTAGVAYAWGANPNGQLGVGDVTPRSSPVAVLGALTFASAYTNNWGNSMGLTTAGLVYGWGFNSSALGTGDLTDRSSPVAVLGGLSFKTLFPALVNNLGQTFAVSTNDTLYGWGVNSGGQLGVGDTTNRSSPVAVLGGRTIFTEAPQKIYDLSVVPGTVYAISITGGIAYFGTTPIGAALSQVVVEYDQ